MLVRIAKVKRNELSVPNFCQMTEKYIKSVLIAIKFVLKKVLHL